MQENCGSVVRFAKNSTGRDFVCGDIHGCFDDLEDELKKVDFDKMRDRLFCVGDLIDRGPKPELAVEYLSMDWFFSTMGNHEKMFCIANTNGLPKSMRDSFTESHAGNGGEWAYKLPAWERRAIVDAVRALPLVIQVGDAVVLHAAMPEVESLDEIEDDPGLYENTILWFRDDEYPEVRIPGVNRVFVGHTIVGQPMEDGKHINIDTGAFFRHWGSAGKLTIMEI